MGGEQTCGAAACNVRLLLACAGVECLPSWAPPILMSLLLRCRAGLAIRCHAHYLPWQSVRNSHRTPFFCHGEDRPRFGLSGRVVDLLTTPLVLYVVAGCLALAAAMSADLNQKR